MELQYLLEMYKHTNNLNYLAGIGVVVAIALLILGHIPAFKLKPSIYYNIAVAIITTASLVLLIIGNVSVAQVNDGVWQYLESNLEDLTIDSDKDTLVKDIINKDRIEFVCHDINNDTYSIILLKQDNTVKIYKGLLKVEYKQIN